MNWRQAYGEKLRSAGDAVALIQDHSPIVQGVCVGEPPALLARVAGCDIPEFRR